MTDACIHEEVRRIAVFLEHRAMSRDQAMQADSAGSIRAASEHRKSADEEARQPETALAWLPRLQSLQILGHAAAGDISVTSVVVLRVGHVEGDAEYKLR